MGNISIFTIPKVNEVAETKLEENLGEGRELDPNSEKAIAARRRARRARMRMQEEAFDFDAMITPVEVKGLRNVKSPANFDETLLDAIELARLKRTSGIEEKEFV